MAKLNAGKKAKFTIDPMMKDTKHPMQPHHEMDEDKMMMARKGNFGTKAQLHDKMTEIHEKMPGMQMTHRHNGTVR